ncbi:HAD-IIIC family phosphatase [Alphaproteobacteria bacterium]|nr:HAD-IIIC family phosphatase [Alphaproteobacteria bacterium]
MNDFGKYFMPDLSFQSPIGFLEAVNLSKHLVGDNKGCSSERYLTKLNVALIGDYSFDQLEYFVRARGSQLGFELSITKGGFGNIAPEILDEGSFLYTKEFDLVIIIPRPKPDNEMKLATSREAVNELIRQQVGNMVRLVNKLQLGRSCKIILANMKCTSRIEMGSLRSRAIMSDAHFVRTYNGMLGEMLPDEIALLDLEHISAMEGARHCADSKMHYVAKTMGSQVFLDGVAREIATLINSAYRPPKKVLVLDLDNTLWGGVIGDDGLDGIMLGQHDAAGEAFVEFQERIMEFKRLGVILCVCSKNFDDVAKEVFLKHPDMVIRLADIAVFAANWKPKHVNIKQIANTLDLGLDSFVFVDDNPAEIEVVNQFLPQVSTILLPENVAEIPESLELSGFFRPNVITEEDRNKTQQYVGLAQAKVERDRHSDIGEYLASLQMNATFWRMGDGERQRVSQLSQKSNQFNLTTIRMTDAEVLQFDNDDLNKVITVRLKDKFVDHGLVSVLFLSQNERELELVNWIMSCRVLGRGMEEFTINNLVNIARNAGCDTIRAAYEPSGRNRLVETLFDRLGFDQVDSNSNQKKYVVKIESFLTLENKIGLTENAKN